jgi:hypothetical protein
MSINPLLSYEGFLTVAAKSAELNRNLSRWISGPEGV